MFTVSKENVAGIVYESVTGFHNRVNNQSSRFVRISCF